MRESLLTPEWVGQEGKGAVGKLSDDQIADRLTWHQIPDSEVATAAMHVIAVRPANGSTITQVNPTDPCTTGPTTPGYLVRPTAYGPVVKAGR